MTPPEDSAVLIESMAPLVPALYRTLDKSDELAEQYFVDHKMAGQTYLSCKRHLARAHARRLLEVEQGSGGLGPWRLSPGGTNVPITLCYAALSLKLLRPTPGESVPPPGRNAARVAYYSNKHDNLLGIRGSRLIGVWSTDKETGLASIRIVRPMGKWLMGSREKIDIDFFLPRFVDELGSLTFEVIDDLEVGLPFEGLDSEDIEPEESDEDGSGEL